MFLKRIKKSNNKSRLLILIGFLIFLLGLGISLTKYSMIFYDDYKRNKQIETYFEKTPKITDVTVDIDDNEIDESIKEKAGSPVYDYIGVLEITKIDLKRGFLNIGDKGNNVNKNIQVIKGSDMPDVTNGNLIIAAHSGNSSIAFFNKLYKLSNGDNANVYFNGIKYTYKVADSYEVEKTGQVVIHRNNDKNCLTLITCSQSKKNKQIVYVFELESEENYE